MKANRARRLNLGDRGEVEIGWYALIAIGFLCITAIVITGNLTGGH